jgi:HEAT repeat protein
MFGRSATGLSYEAALRDARSKTTAARVAAATALGTHGQDHREGALAALDGLLEDREGDVRTAAVLALADMKAEERVDALLGVSRDPHAETADMALAALGELRAEAALPRIEEALGAKRPGRRFQAVMAFARVCSDAARVRRALLAASDDDDELVRHIALRMAEETAGEGGDVHPDFLDRSKALLGDESDIVRVAAAVLLGHAGLRDGAEVLVGVAGRTVATDQHDDQAAAIELCGDLGLREALPVLRERAYSKVLLFQNDPFAWHARVALAALGDDKAVRWVLDELGAWTRERRTLAVAAAGRARVASARPVIAAMRGDASRADPDAVAEALARLSE